ncbi:MAG: GNAT family N-acetyltransferase [Amphritea sp.]
MIRVAESQDISEIARIHAQGWHNSYNTLLPKHILEKTDHQSMLKKWQNWFISNSQEIHIIVENNDIVGFVHTCMPRQIQYPPQGFGELHHLYLTESCIGREIGHKLFEHAICQLKSNGYNGMLLWTLEGNSQAKAFYESHGMSLDGARRDDPDWLGPDIFEVRYCLPF